MKTIKETAFIVSLGTLLSKFGGMARQLVIAGAFGISAAYDAYNYAYIIPGFFLVLLGGINGPLHNSMVTLLADKNKVDSKLFISSINNILSLILLIISFFIFFSSDLLIKFINNLLSTLFLSANRVTIELCNGPLIPPKRTKKNPGII